MNNLMNNLSEEEKQFILFKNPVLTDYDFNELNRFSKLSRKEQKKELESLKENYVLTSNVTSFYDKEIKELYESLKKDYYNSERKIKSLIDEIYEKESEELIRKEIEVKNLIKNKIDSLDEKEQTIFQKVYFYKYFDLTNKKSKLSIKRSLGYRGNNDD